MSRWWLDWSPAVAMVIGVRSCSSWFARLGCNLSLSSPSSLSRGTLSYANLRSSIAATCFPCLMDERHLSSATSVPKLVETPVGLCGIRIVLCDLIQSCLHYFPWVGEQGYRPEVCLVCFTSFLCIRTMVAFSHCLRSVLVLPRARQRVARNIAWSPGCAFKASDEILSGPTALLAGATSIMVRILAVKVLSTSNVGLVSLVQKKRNLAGLAIWSVTYGEDEISWYFSYTASMSADVLARPHSSISGGRCLSNDVLASFLTFGQNWVVVAGSVPLTLWDPGVISRFDSLGNKEVDCAAALPRAEGGFRWGMDFPAPR
eukprot:IDg8100t1